MEINAIIEKISEGQGTLFSGIKQESIDVYKFLQDEYMKGSIESNYLFQFVFRSYYRLDNAGLSDKMKESFFRLLSNKKVTLKDILSELYNIPTLKGKQTIQFSFATKLLHTINNDLPIFDSEVGMVFNMRVKGADKNKKIDSCEEIYAKLRDLYEELQNNKQIKEIVSKFRRHFNLTTEISDGKVLDFIIWSLGKTMKKTQSLQY
jgi:hypothetical protein